MLSKFLCSMSCKPIFLVNLILRPQPRQSHLKSHHALLSEANQYPCNLTQNLVYSDACQENHDRTLTFAT